jgi:hypothetical protein
MQVGTCRSWPKIKAVAALFLLTCLAAACGKDGESGGGGVPLPEVPSPQEPDPLRLTTRVGIDAMGYRLPLTSSCLKPEVGASIPQLTTFDQRDVTATQFSEWDKVPAQLNDSVGDAPSGLDIGEVRVGQVNDDLALAISLAPGEQTEMYVELGGVLIKKSSLFREQRILLKWSANAPTLLEQWQNAAFVTVHDPDTVISLGQRGLELKLSRRFLGDAVTWPAFWIRVYTKSQVNVEGSSLTGGDSTHAAYFSSMLGGDAVTFGASACSSWATQSLSFSMQHLMDKKPRLELEDSRFSMERASEAAFQLTRFAFDATRLFFPKEPLPLAKLYVIATTGSVSQGIKMLDFDTETQDLAFLYGALTLNVSDLDQTSSEFFPQGVVLRQAATRFIDLHLQAAYREAPSYLRRVVRMALTDHLLEEQVGPSYLLDSYLPTVSAFLGKKAVGDLAKPEIISERIAKLADPSLFPSSEAYQNYKTETEQKIAGLGHLFFAEFTPEILVSAWKKAAAIASTGKTPEEALRLALILMTQAKVENIEKLSNLEKQQLALAVSDLWPGWLAQGLYVIDAARGVDRSPKQLDDVDLDGLPAFYERMRQTSDNMPDTDKDGWNDIAEVVAGTDPREASMRPQTISPDGNFGDWLELVPKRVLMDKGVFGSCPRAANISHYAALVNRDSLIIGAYSDTFWEAEPRAKWEAVLDFSQSNQQFLVTAISGSRQILVKDGKSLRTIQTINRAMPLARQVIEWTLSRESLGVATYFNKTEGIKIRLRTVYNDGDGDGEDHFCDETDWFGPAISQ